MRIDVKKFLFFGASEEKDLFFRRAQEAGIIHFIESKKSPGTEVPQWIQNYLSAIKILRGLPVTEQVELDDYTRGDAICEEILDRKSRLDKLEEERRILALEMARIEVFGDFSLDDIKFIEENSGRHIQFFFSKKNLFQNQELPDEMFWIDSDHGLDYFIAVNETPRQYDDMIEMLFDDSYGSLQQRSLSIDQEIHRLDEELKEYEKYNTFLHHAFTYRLNSFHRQVAEGYASPVMDERLFIVTGWVPKDKEEQMRDFVSQMDIHVEEVAIEDDDSVPTYLENKGVSRVGEDLVYIYDTPSVTDRDPSLWVLASFAIFFSLIISDGGYGLVFLATSLFIMWKTQKITKLGRTVLNLSIILSTACIIWGVASNSFFGIQFAADSPIRQVSLVHWLAKKKAAYHISHKDATYQEWVKKFPDLRGVNNPEEFLEKGVKEADDGVSYEILDKFADNVMMELALVVGMIHIILSFIRYIDRNWAGIGWIMVIIGGYLYIPEYLQATSMLHYVFGVDKASAAFEGQILMVGGVILAVVLSFIRDFYSGLLEITNSIQIFADILSYLRLYALGLAGSIISATINEIAGSIFLLGGILLILIGHTVNMLLSIIGGVIHGLRLNFIEWYHYSFEGGGKLFNPLKKVEIE